MSQQFYSEKFRDRLRGRIARLGLQAYEVAEQIGVKPTALSNWLAGRNGPKPRNVRRLADVLNCNYEWLAGGDVSELILNDSPPAREKPASSPHAFTEIATLEKTLAELTARLSKSTPHERKFILSNLRDVMDELDARELSSKPLSAEQELARRAAGEKGGKH